MITVTAPSNGVVADVFVREGDVVGTGAPVLRLVDYNVARDELRYRRDADSLAVGAQAARVRSRHGESDVLTVQSAGATASADESRARLDAMRIRALVGGEVLTMHPERLRGRHVQFGDTLLQLADLTGVEAIIRLRGSGAVNLRPGNPVKLLSYRDAARPLEGVVDAVSPVADATGRASGTVEVRIRLNADAISLAGATGEARVTWRRASLLAAVVWSVRSRLRSDLLL
jgi:multidrug resistance efflux pump